MTQVVNYIGSKSPYHSTCFKSAQLQQGMKDTQRHVIYMIVADMKDTYTHDYTSSIHVFLDYCVQYHVVIMCIGNLYIILYYIYIIKLYRLREVSICVCI